MTTGRFPKPTDRKPEIPKSLCHDVYGQASIPTKRGCFMRTAEPEAFSPSGRRNNILPRPPHPVSAPAADHGVGCMQSNADANVFVWCRVWRELNVAKFTPLCANHAHKKKGARYSFLRGRVPSFHDRHPAGYELLSISAATAVSYGNEQENTRGAPRPTSAATAVLGVAPGRAAATAAALRTNHTSGILLNLLRHRLRPPLRPAVSAAPTSSS